jgi:hypothetical protein
MSSINDDWQAKWSKSFENEFSNFRAKCECGLHKTYGIDTNLPHSDYCPLYRYIANTSCNCGSDLWHSVGCQNRDKKVDDRLI